MALDRTRHFVWNFRAHKRRNNRFEPSLTYWRLLETFVLDMPQNGRDAPVTCGGARHGLRVGCPFQMGRLAPPTVKHTAQESQVYSVKFLNTGRFCSENLSIVSSNCFPQASYWASPLDPTGGRSSPDPLGYSPPPKWKLQALHWLYSRTYVFTNWLLQTDHAIVSVPTIRFC